MRVLLDLNHPAHVHFFKNLYWKLKDEGHEVFVVASKKDINFKLLENYNIPFINIGTYGNSIISKFYKLILLDLKMVFILLRYRPDYVLGINTIRGAHAGIFFKDIKVFVFTDTEHAEEQIVLYKRVTNKVYTPDCFTKDLGCMQVKYAGYHELAYLHPNWFEPNPSVLQEFEVTEEDKYFILRFVSWKATHDIGQKGFSNENKRKVISLLEQHGKVFVTSEAKLPNEFDKYKISVSPEKIHHLMYYSQMYIGEGGTMASEASCMGVPSLLVNTLTAGTFVELEDKYKLLTRTTDNEEILNTIDRWLNTKNIKEEYLDKRKKLLDDKIDVTQFIYDQLTNV